MTIAAQVARDVWRIADQDAVNAEYRRGGTGAPVAVRCKVTPAGPRYGRPAGTPGAIAGGGGATLTGSTFMLTLPAPQDGEGDQGNGVTASGGIVQLKASDTLDVPGAAVNQPAAAAPVRLRVGGNVKFMQGYWTAEVST